MQNIAKDKCSFQTYVRNRISWRDMTELTLKIFGALLSSETCYSAELWSWNWGTYFVIPLRNTYDWSIDTCSNIVFTLWLASSWKYIETQLSDDGWSIVPLLPFIQAYVSAKRNATEPWPEIAQKSTTTQSSPSQGCQIYMTCVYV